VKFSGLSGAFLSQVMPLGTCGLLDAQSMAFGLNGHLFISCDFVGVIEVDAATGASLGIFGQTQILSDFLPTLSFSPSDNALLVARGLANAVDGFSWPDGQPLGHFVSPGSGGLDVNPDIFDGTWDGRSGMAYGPNGNLFISTYFPQGVLEFTGTCGAPLGLFSSMTPPPPMVLGPESLDHELLFVPLVGDTNSDWHVDLRDAREFQNCYTGEGASASNSNCLTWFDYDRDGHIASPDVAGFVEAFTGP
jgi:hypothetical protein